MDYFIILTTVASGFTCLGILIGRKWMDIIYKSKWTKELNSSPRIGLFTENLVYTINDKKESIKVKMEVREVAKGKNKSKIEYLAFHVTPKNYNNEEKWDEIKEYLGPWIDTNRIEWYLEFDTRQKKIERLLNK